MMSPAHKGIPRVSVCIPTYNHAHFIGQAIESVLVQTYADFELVVVDNCSTDNTRELVSTFSAIDQRIRYVCNERNVGPQENLNRCLAEAAGEYVKILCADDFIAPTCLEKSIQLLNDHPRVTLVSSARQIVDEQLNPLRVAAFAVKDQLLDGKFVINYTLFNGNYIGEPSAALFRRRDADAGFNKAFRLMIDVEFWLRLLEQGDFAFIAEPLCSFRIHGGQETNSVVASLDFIDEELALLRKYADKPYVSASVVQHIKWACKVAWVLPLRGYAAIDRNQLLQRVKAVDGRGALYWVFLFRSLLGAALRKRL